MTDSTQQHAAIQAEQLALPAVSNIPTFCMCTSRDEAQWALGIVDKGGRWPFTGFDLLGRLIDTVFDNVPGLIGKAQVVTRWGQFLRPLDNLSGSAISTTLGIVLALPVVAVLGLIGVAAGCLVLTLQSPIVRRLSYWGEELSTSMLVDIRAQQTAPGWEPKPIYRSYDFATGGNLLGVARRLRRWDHSALCTDPRVVSDVAKWLRTGML